MQVRKLRVRPRGRGSFRVDLLLGYELVQKGAAVVTCGQVFAVHDTSIRASEWANGRRLATLTPYVCTASGVDGAACGSPAGYSASAAWCPRGCMKCVMPGRQKSSRRSARPCRSLGAAEVWPLAWTRRMSSCSESGHDVFEGKSDGRRLRWQW
jgi:hypothetical protein